MWSLATGRASLRLSFGGKEAGAARRRARDRHRPSSLNPSSSAKTPCITSSIDSPFSLIPFETSWIARMTGLFQTDSVVETAQESGEPLRPGSSGLLTYRLQHTRRAGPALCPGRVLPA